VRDLWSANDQMQKVVAAMAQQATDDKLRTLLEKSVAGIQAHTKTLQSMIPQDSSSQCKGMEGLVAEVDRHALEADLPPQLRDLELISQYQRMSHYGLAGFGTAAAYAGAIGLPDEAEKLKSIVADIYNADDYSTRLAENVEKAAAQSL
jgi:ferritin-like metal-binding protein YciE